MKLHAGHSSTTPACINHATKNRQERYELQFKRHNKLDYSKFIRLKIRPAGEMPADFARTLKPLAALWVNTLLMLPG